MLNRYLNDLLNRMQDQSDQETYKYMIASMLDRIMWLNKSQK
jgi:hypothetical protein